MDSSPRTPSPTSTSTGIIYVYYSAACCLFLEIYEVLFLCLYTFLQALVVEPEVEELMDPNAFPLYNLNANESQNFDLLLGTQGWRRFIYKVLQCLYNGKFWMSITVPTTTPCTARRLLSQTLTLCHVCTYHIKSGAPMLSIFCWLIITPMVPITS